MQKDQVDLGIKKIEHLFQTSQFQEGLELCQQLETDPMIPFELRKKAIIFKLRFLEKLEYYKEGIKQANELLQNQSVLGDTLFQVSILIELTKLYFSKGMRDKVIETIQQAEEHLYHDDSLDSREMEIKMAELVLLRGGYEWQRGELENALFFFKFNLELRKKHGSELDLAHALNNVGVIYNALGDLAKSLKYLKEAMQKYKEIGSTRGISKTGHNIGAILIQMGELDESLKYMTESLKIDEKDHYRDGIRVALQNMGEVYWHKRWYKEALDNLTKCLAMVEEKEQFLEMSEACIPLIAIHLEQNNQAAAYRCLTILYQIHYDNPNKLIAQRYWLAKGMYFKYLNTPHSMLKAEFYLNQVVQDEVRYFDITAMAMVELTDLYVKEMFNSKSPQYNPALDFILSEMIQLTRQNHSYSMAAESLLLKAKLAFIKGETGYSHELLQQAMRLAEDHNLNRLYAKAVQELDDFLERDDFWQLEQVSQNLEFKVSSAQYQDLKKQIRAILAPTQITDDSNKQEKMGHQIIPECLLLFTPQGRIFLHTPFNSKWEQNSLHFSVFQINLMGFLQDFAAKGIAINRYEDVKLHFFNIRDIMGCFIYKGPLAVAVEKIAVMIPKIDLYYPRLMEYQEMNSQQQGYVNLLQQEFYYLISSLSSA